MLIEHASVNWENYIPKNVKTLILGSFNPNNLNNNTDYYYGRSSNYFWKVIADILNYNEDYFCGSLDRKKVIMDKYKFCFKDLIQEIELSGEQEILEKFISQKIFKEFTDQILFTSKTNFSNIDITIKRKYDVGIFHLLSSNNICNVIHTLGNSTIDKKLKTKWKEKSLKDKGFQGFIQEINVLCKIEEVSFSPSGRAVRSGGLDYYPKLKEWMKKNIIVEKDE